MPKTTLSAEELAKNFAALHPPLTRDEAVAEASRCVFCFDAPCTRACPAHIDVPRFIRQILHDNSIGAAETIFTENILGGSCARACPTEVLCEGACVDRVLQGAPIPIGRLQRFATDHAMALDLRFFEPGPDTGKKVAVVGAGPAGLACAHALRQCGHAVTVFEARDVAGGLGTLGIAPYKLTAEFALSELEAIWDMGVEVKLNAPVDAQGIADLRASHDAVFLGLGLGPTASLGIPGEEAEGVWEALDFILPTHTGPLTACEVGRRVVVIGGGNTAVDAATQASRLGAEEVIIAYRRTEREAPAFRDELALARADGCRFLWSTAPVEFVTEGGKLTGVKCRRTVLEGSGRGAKVRVVEGSDFVIACDMAIAALGQVALKSLIAEIEGLTVERGQIVVDPETGATSVPGLWAGGDCVNGGAEIINAVQAGKVAARAIDARIKEGVR